MSDVYPKYSLPSGGWSTDKEHAELLWARAGRATAFAEVSALQAKCAYCGHTGPAELFVNINDAGNLACKSLQECARRQAEAAGLDGRLRSMAYEVRAGSVLCSWEYLADRIETELGQDYDTAAALAGVYWEMTS